MQDIEQMLNEAFEKIENGDRAGAQQILEPLLNEEPDNPDVWWLYAHAVDDEAKGREALERVLQLDPGYPGARELLGELTTQQMPAARLDDIPDEPLEPDPPIPTTIPDDIPWEDEFEASTRAVEDDLGEIDDELVMAESVGEEKEEAAPSRIPLILLLIGVLVLAVVAAFLIFGQPGDPGQETPASIAEGQPSPTTPPTAPVIEPAAETAEALETDGVESSPDAPTPEPTNVEAEIISPTPDTVETELPVPTEDFEANDGTEVDDITDTPEETIEASAPGMETAEATQEVIQTAEASTVDLNAIAESLVAAQVPPDGILFTETVLGETLAATTCANPGPAASEAMDTIMDELAQAAAEDTFTGDAIAVRIADCATETTLRTIGASRDDALAYVNSEMSASDFKRTWRPIE